MGKDLLRTTWLEGVVGLTDTEVKDEIIKVLDIAKELDIKKIIVDSRLYPFRDNYDIQRWINHSFMPRIMACGVKKYAIIVETVVDTKVDSLYEQDVDEMQVEYFTSLAEAQLWIES